MENKGGDTSDERGLVVVLTVALIASFLAIAYQRWPFNQPAPSLIPSPFVRACRPFHPYH